MLDVRAFVAADMWGTRGTLRRRRIIRAEFVGGVVGCVALGCWVLATASGVWLVVGVWLVGAGVNYLPLAVCAWSLSRPCVLEHAPRLDLRSAGVQQLWIAVPCAVAIAAGINSVSAR